MSNSEQVEVEQKLHLLQRELEQAKSAYTLQCSRISQHLPAELNRAPDEEYREKLTVKLEKLEAEYRREAESIEGLQRAPKRRFRGFWHRDPVPSSHNNKAMLGLQCELIRKELDEIKEYEARRLAALHKDPKIAFARENILTLEQEIEQVGKALSLLRFRQEYRPRIPRQESQSHEL